ncbi:hypothetical protein QFC22_004889 [Naganishia vaughanmartiniae]|uniref:Uncharacterized protein n=1 Tax=Naganishia vaughanmartiniae TaxID=1424756 RepID=A0ACC2X115_9TREE|nr:hypothetical protein QFC22_004889 [Naganishia vaughanmartiniae]
MSTIGSGSESREASARQLEIGMEEKRRTKGLTWVVRDSLKLARLAVQDRRRWIRDRKRFETNRELDGPLAYSLRHTQFLENLEDLLGTVLRYLYDVNEALVAWSGNVLDKEDVVRQEVVRLVSSLEGCQFEKDLKKPLEDLEKFFDRMQSMTNEIQ